MTDVWEYRLHNVSFRWGANQEQKFNSLGREGWEMVAFMPGKGWGGKGYAIFKRRASPQPQ